MRILFWVGLVALALGIVSFVVPIPRTEQAGVKAGGISIGVETRRQEKVSPVVSVILILGGAGMMLLRKAKSS
jgi:hypothetical protein